jgi:hypothetical protein
LSLIALLLLAVLYGFCTFVAWRGVRNTLSRPVLGLVATICMVVLGVAAWNSLSLLNLGMQAYAMGVQDDLIVPVDLFQIGALATVVKFAPLWLLGKA